MAVLMMLLVKSALSVQLVGGVVSPAGFFLPVQVMVPPYAAAWACSHARTSLTFHAVIASPNFVGAGKDWARTLRHKVAALNGRGVGKFGRLGSRTS